MTIAHQPALLHMPMVGLTPISVDEANQLLVAWGHRLGPVNRPFRQEAYAVELAGMPISIATSGSIVGATAGGYGIQECVELTRLCSDPEYRWATRIMLRLWREVCGPAWGLWPVRAAVSYAHNAMHRGDLYRFDGWEKVSANCGSNGGGTWSTKRIDGDPIRGSKSLWVWRYEP